MQKPTVRVRAFTEYPYLHAINVKNGVVIASDFTSVPPTCFNTFNIAKKSQRASTTRNAIDFFQLLRRWEQPQRSTKGAPGGCDARASSWRNTCARQRRLAHTPGPFGTVRLHHLKTVDRLVSEACAQNLDQCR